MLTLEVVKQSLAIDFTDQDEYLTQLMDTAMYRASRITGIPITIDVVDESGVVNTIPNPSFHTSEIEGAMLDDIAAMYQDRGEPTSGSIKSVLTYRQLSIKPMF